MPIITIPQSIHDLASELQRSLSEGRGARAQIGDKGVAFSWTSGLPPTLADYVALTSVSGLSFDAVVAKPSGTPAGKVAAGGTKNLAVSFDTTPVALSKYAGRAEFQLEQLMTSDALASVCYQVLSAQVLTAFEADAVAEVIAGAGVTATGAIGSGLAGAVLAGQATVLGAGGRPGLLIVSPGDYAELMTGTVGGYGGARNGDTGPAGVLYGMVIHVSPAASDGAPIVADPAAITIGQNELSPVGIVDPFSMSSTNVIRLVLDLVAGTVVTSPGSVCVCDVGGSVAATSSSSKSSKS